MKHRKQPLRGFLQNRFYDTLALKQMLQKITESADFLGKNCCKPATLL